MLVKVALGNCHDCQFLKRHPLTLTTAQNDTSSGQAHVLYSVHGMRFDLRPDRLPRRAIIKMKSVWPGLASRYLNFCITAHDCAHRKWQPGHVTTNHMIGTSTENEALWTAIIYVYLCWFLCGVVGNMSLRYHDLVPHVNRRGQLDTLCLHHGINT